MLVGYLVVAIAVAVAALLLVPATDRSTYFWPRLIWAEFLVFLTWSFHGGLAYIAGVKAGASSRIMGIIPGVGIVVTIYTAISFGFMLAASHFEGDHLSNYHFVAQVIAAAGAVLFCVSMFASAEIAAEGAEPLPADLRSPGDLALLVEQRETGLRPLMPHARELIESLKSLREQVRYGLPDVGSIGASAQYRKFASEVEDLCAKVEQLPVNQQGERDAGLARLRDAVGELKAGLPLIQQSLKRV